MCLCCFYVYASSVMREKYITCNFHIMNKIRICEFLVSQTMIDCESENLTHERSVSLLPFFFF